MKVIVLDGHPRQEELAAYVSDTLDPARAERLETHVFDCSRCAARLQDAASFQVLLHDAAESFEARPPAAPSPARRFGRRIGAVGGLWAAAAALALVIVRPGSSDTEPVPIVTLAEAPDDQVPDELRWSSCAPNDPDCAGSMLATVEPLESVDPLSSWPDDPQVRAGFSDGELVDGEPCGSGEDGGTLVCPTTDDPFSG